MTNKKSDWQFQIKDDQHSGEKVMWLVWYLFGSTSSVVLPEVSAVFGGKFWFYPNRGLSAWGKFVLLDL